MAAAAQSRLAHVADVHQLEAEGRLQVCVDEHEILLVRLSGGIVAVANRCPHLGCELREGTVRGRTIQCPAHGWKFDLDSGQVPRHWWSPPSSRGARARLPRYRVHVDGTRVLVELPG